MSAGPRIIAVDWSGDSSRSAAKKIWLAEVADGRVVRLESGRDRDAMAKHLAAIARDHRELIVGLDFAFSFPRWYLEQLGLSDAVSLWRLVAREGERWLQECELPLWGRPGKGKPELPEAFRRTERSIGRTAGISPKSVFQIGGAGAVGTGSIRGMPTLARLRDAGYAIWPFDAPRLPLAVEIYPRLLTGPVNKSSADARYTYLQRYAGLPDHVMRDAAASEDAFDALVSALVMWERREKLLELTQTWRADDTIARIEGEIWSAPIAASSRADSQDVRDSHRPANLRSADLVHERIQSLREAIDRLPPNEEVRARLAALETALANAVR